MCLNIRALIPQKLIYVEGLFTAYSMNTVFTYPTRTSRTTSRTSRTTSRTSRTTSRTTLRVVLVVLEVVLVVLEVVLLVPVG